MKKICVITGTRADYGLLKNLLKGIEASKKLVLQLVVTGNHFSHQFGYTVEEIEADEIPISWRLDMLMSSNNSVGSTKSVGVAILGFAEVFSALKPDLLLVLGDRYEIFAAASSAMMMQIPIMHLHGGERTEGLIDESIRHSVTKMAHIHCVSTEQSKRNVIQMGENPRNVHNVGAMGLDSISPEITLTRSQLAEKLRFRFKNKNLLVTFHPLTLEPERSLLDLGELLSALGSLGDVGIIFTYANADNGGILLNNRIHSRFVIF